MTREQILSIAKPILFNTEMVRAILDGRKTQTRRLIKPQPLFFTGRHYIFADEECPKKWEDCADFVGTFRHQRGDSLYVRETWAAYSPTEGTMPELIYLADGKAPKGVKWKPSIHMPKEAARIFLRVTDVRVERLQDITGQDANAEGCTFYGFEPFISADEMETAKEQFQRLWDSTIKKSDRDEYGWNANPWVWVYTFERIDPDKEDGDKS